MPQVTQATLDALGPDDSTYTLNGETERVIERRTPGPWNPEFSEGGDVDYLFLGPGGSGGVDGGGTAVGGAGAGGFLRGTASFAASTYAMEVGDSGPRRVFTSDGQGPGAAGTPTRVALAATPSSYLFEALPGSPSVRRGEPYPAGPFGSGAGASAGSDAVNSAGTPGQGFDGGARTQPDGFWQAASGGSAASPGADQLRTQARPAVNPGAFDDITGTSEEYGRGGRGATFQGNYPTSEIDGRPGFGDGAGGQSEANNGTHKEGGKGGSGAIILRFTLPAAGGDPVNPTGILQPAPQVPIATLTAATTVEPTGIRQAAPHIPQGGLTAATTLQPDGIAQAAPQMPQGALTAFTTLAPVGIRQPEPRIPQTDVGSGVSLAPVGIRQPAPLVPLGALTATTTLPPVGIRQPTPRIPQAELPTSAVSPIGIRQTAPRIPQAGVTAAATLNPTGIRHPGPRLPRLTFPAPIAPVVAIGEIINARAVRGPKVMQATAARGPKTIHAAARRDV